MLYRLVFLFVQILLLPYGITSDRTGNDLHVKSTTDSTCESVMTKVLRSSFCNFTGSSHVFDCCVSWPGSWHAGSPRWTSTSPSEATKAGRIGVVVRRPVGSSAATMPNRLWFLFVQVRLEVNDCFCYSSDDRFLLLLPCPHMFVSCVI
ncbi:hypothetical protein ISCGN_023564 [Ixodes scapularis]